jgi:hypothetical protein
MSQSTGETCGQSGIFLGKCSNGHDRQAVFAKGEVFPPCHEGKCRAIVQWDAAKAGEKPKA